MFSLDDNVVVTESTAAITEQDASRVIKSITADRLDGNDCTSMRMGEGGGQVADIVGRIKLAQGSMKRIVASA
jgi:hypothetical protein